MVDREGDKGNRKRPIAYAVLAAAVLVSVILLWRGGAGHEDEAPAPRRIAVEVIEVSTRSLDETVRGIGTLRAPAQVTISSEMAGRVQALRFEEGSAVEEGDVLVELDARKLRSQVAATEAALEAARVNVANLERSFARHQQLMDQSLVSEEVFELVRTDLESARAEVDRFRAELALAREQLRDTVITAPFAGSISERLVDPGAYVSPGDALARLYQLDPLDLSFSVPERFAGRIARGQPVQITVAAFPDVQFNGEITFVSPSVDEDTRTLAVKARVPNPDQGLKPGSYAAALVTVGRRENRPVLPSEALVATRTGYMVFVVEEGRAVSRAVDIGLREDNDVEITEGLSPGEVVVRSGHMRLNPGMPVEIVNSSQMD